jgi:acyl dehydratase
MTTPPAPPPLAALAARHLLSQRKVIAALAGVVGTSVLREPTRAGARLPELPGPELQQVVPPPSERLIRDYLRHLGVDVAAHAGLIPPHLFPHWSLPLAARSARGLPYRLVRAVNAGCRLRMNAPLVVGRPLEVRARLVSVKDDGRRAVVQQRVVTGQPGHEGALEADLFLIVPSGAPQRGAAPRERTGERRPSVPENARELSRFRLGPNAGLAFAVLTGDFNPVHWLGPYARAAGFDGPILHGFATFARVIEALRVVRFEGATDRLACIDMRFTRPLSLPAEVGLYLAERELYVGRSPGEQAFASGTFEERPARM